MLFPQSWVAGALALVGVPALGGVSLTADVYETPGMAGYWTYDLTATANDGYLNGFSFTGGGISGPLHHGGDPTSPLYGFFDPVFGGLTGSKADTHWLTSASDMLSIQVGQSSSSLTTASVFMPSSGQRDINRNLPFARVVTNDPAAVNLRGDFLVNQRWSDGGFGESVLHNIQMSLNEIAIGAPAALGSFPDRPLPPIYTPPVFSPPAYEPPVYTPPVVEPPVYVPPVYSPPAFVPPVYDPPVVVPPSVTPPMASRVVLSAEAIDTPGLSGYRTYTVTATAIDGYLNAFDFTNFAGGTNGITGPLHHGTPSLENLNADRLFASGPADPTDSQWLVSLQDGLAIGAEQSSGGIEAAYTFLGTGDKRDTYRRLDLVQLVTNDPSAVTLSGEVVLTNAWSDGTVDPIGWDSRTHAVTATLSDLVGVTPPELGALPDRPVPTQPPIVVTEPPGVVAVQIESPIPGDAGGCRRGCIGLDAPFPETPAEVIDVPTVVVDQPVFIDNPAGETPGVVVVYPPYDIPFVLVDETGTPWEVPAEVPIDWYTFPIYAVPANEVNWGLIDFVPGTDVEGNLRPWNTDTLGWSLMCDGDSQLLAYDVTEFRLNDGEVNQRLVYSYARLDGSVGSDSLAADQSSIPEPGAGLLVGVGILAVGARRGRR